MSALQLVGVIFQRSDQAVEILGRAEKVGHCGHSGEGDAEVIGQAFQIADDLLDEIFDPASNASFQWERWGTLRGKRMHVFSFRVPQATSKYSIFHGGTKRTIVAGYHGYIYVDRDLGFVAKIAMECDSIPVDFPVQTVKLDLDYDFTKIGTQDFVLPLKTSLKSREGKYLSWNEAEFRLYKKFGTETTVTFEPLEPLSEDATKEQPPVPDTKK